MRLRKQEQGLMVSEDSEKNGPSVHSQEPSQGKLQAGLMSDPHSHSAQGLKVPLRLHHQDTGYSGSTLNLSASGLRMKSGSPFNIGTPMTLQCAFGEVCYLTLSGQVTSCLPGDDATGIPRYHVIDVKFSAVRPWEEKVLASAIQELKENPSTLEKSLVTIHAEQDLLAVEASAIANEPIQSAANGPNPDGLEVGPVTQGSEKAPKRNVKKGLKVTPDPEWVLEMNRYLDPYRQAIWQSRLVQETSLGQLSLKQVRGWSVQFYPFIEYFPQFMANYLAKATDPGSRAFLIDNLRVEKRHADQWIDMANGFGVPTEELFSTPIVPEVEALTHWMWSITGRGSFVEAVAATNFAIEGVTQGIATIMVKGFDKYHGQRNVHLEKKAYYWMQAHSAYDDLHPIQALEIIKRHATTPESQQKVKHAAQRSLEYLYKALNACYWAYAPEPSEVKSS